MPAPSHAYVEGAQAAEIAEQQALALAARRGANEYVHRHPHGHKCVKGCVLIAPDGSRTQVVQ